ncbi:MAG: SDR family oxidoreductase [Anaerolineae bacterium]|jgi:nucleoside-diphosphate-sugar epimerase|nr:MAG: NAD-dependent epimerase/dehydratase [Chloroflexi bacterium OLB13]MBC6957107.1 NAD-dependent epimerase/dehydratase family protein [Chloroflexota bacterium]MBV6436567.1 UDP-N-acetylglucosamine 4-epimerase [Anaerolineae bacterium]MDL1916059.1 SDR family oxidoreductase [Anaerolineae bacterium CFX4]MBW7879635.1 SDR family oxidoreductase [Anaerolineae bacterium]
MRYAVTGGAGFIGSHIADRLLQDGHDVVVIDNLLTGSAATIDWLKARANGRLTFAQVSITDSSLPDVIRGVDTIFHQAALPSVPRSVDNPLETHHHCVTGTLNVLESARHTGVRRVVYAASSSAYGDQPGDSKSEDMTPQPISPYGVAKLAGEYYCQTFTRVYGLETVCLRYFNVFGPRQDPNSQYAAVIPRFITALLHGEPPTIYGDGTQSRDFTYIDNVVHGNLLASTSQDAVGEVMNLATGGRVSLLELADKLNTIIGTSIAPVFGPAREGDIKHSRAAIDKARNLLDFAPVVDFDTGLARTVDWYRAQAVQG